MTRDQAIQELTNRFLSWRLPADFNPDGGISFKAEYGNGTPEGGRFQPVGTNLFNAPQAKAMIEYLLEAEGALIILLTPEMDEDVPLSADDRTRIDAAWEAHKATELRVVDNDQDEISVTSNGKQLRGWSYSDDAERRVKMLCAREFVEGFYHHKSVTA